MVLGGGAIHVYWGGEAGGPTNNTQPEGEEGKYMGIHHLGSMKKTQVTALLEGKVGGRRSSEKRGSTSRCRNTLTEVTQVYGKGSLQKTSFKKLKSPVGNLVPQEGSRGLPHNQSSSGETGLSLLVALKKELHAPGGL